MFKIKFLLILCLVVAGCTSVPKAPVSINTQQLQQQLSQMQQWRFNGRLAFKSPREKKSANIHWQQDKQNFELKLTTFLGIGILDMRGGPGFALLNADDKTYQDSNASRLLFDITGRILPVEHMQDWLKGQANAAAIATYAPQGWLTQLQDPISGWHITYGGYREVAGTWLPHNLQFQRQEQQIKLRIQQWISK